jgi:C4-dicarboxylate transporter, DctM subunit
MDPILIVVFSLVAMFLLILLNVPIGIAMATAGVVGFGFMTNFAGSFSVLATETIRHLSSLDMAVIPLFLLMGNFANTAGISSDIYNMADAFLGHRRGGLAMATVVGCGLFGSVCGSSIATTATFGRVALPEMIKRGYAPTLATGCIAAGGTLGGLVPPSIFLVVYAVISEEFIIELFLAAIFPAILTISLYFVATSIFVRINQKAGPIGARMGWAERLRVLSKSWSAILLIAVIAIGIYGGIFTVTEAAALGAIMAFLFALARRKMTLPLFWQALTGTALTTGMIYIVIPGANTFNYLVVVSHIPDILTEAIVSSGWPQFVILIVILLLYIAMGSIFESVAAMVLTLPFVLPLIVAMGYSPVWWGIVNVVVIEIGLITPPIGLNVFVLHGVAKDYPLKIVFKGIVPYLAADIVRLSLIVLFPAIALWLPTYFK